MDYKDYANASRTQTEIHQLEDEIQRLGNDTDSQKYERNFQKWAEELTYQFSKAVSLISTTPADPSHDYLDIASFLDIIKKNNLSTSLISGIEHKEKFEQTLKKAQSLLDELRTPKVQDYLRLYEEARLTEERFQDEKRRTAEIAKRAIHRNAIISDVIWGFIGLVIASTITSAPFNDLIKQLYNINLGLDLPRGRYVIFLLIILIAGRKIWSHKD